MGDPSKYLLNPLRKGTAAHIWTGKDTACRMWSTNGMNQRKHGLTISDNPGLHRVCLMCINSTRKPDK